MSSNFKSNFTFEERRLEAMKIGRKYPDRVPVIVERAAHTKIEIIDKFKFLVPSDVTVAQFIWIIRQRLTIDQGKAIYLFINRVLPQNSSTMGSVYENYKDDDGFLYVVYSGENTFG